MRYLNMVQMSYVPDVAPVNRFLAFAKAYGENGINVKCIYLYPDKERHKFTGKFHNVEFIYLWDSFEKKNKYYIFIHSFVKLFFILKNNIPVIFYGLCEFLFLFRLNKNLKMYHEMTEHPFYGGKPSTIFARINAKLYLNTCKKLQGLFVISPSLRRFFVDVVKVDESRVHVINMVVDEGRFNNLKLSNDNHFLTYCGTISLHKDGVDILIKAFSKVKAKFPNIKLKLIGPFENDDVKKKIFDLIVSLNLTDNICMPGKISSEKMPLELVNSRLLLLSRPTSIQAQYGFPTKLGEYLMTGNPVLLTRVGDIDFYLKDLESVIFAKPDMIEEFAQKIDWVLSNPDKAFLIGENGRKVALKSFNNMIESEKVLNVIY